MVADAGVVTVARESEADALRKVVQEEVAAAGKRSSARSPCSSAWLQDWQSAIIIKVATFCEVLNGEETSRREELLNELLGACEEMDAISNRVRAKRARVPQLAAQVATNEVQHTVSAEAAIAADDDKAIPAPVSMDKQAWHARLDATVATIEQMAGPLDSLPPELQTRIAALKETIASVAGALKSSETETEAAIRKAPAGLADLQEVPAAAAAAAALNPKADARAAARRQRTAQALEASSASATGKVAQLFDR